MHQAVVSLARRLLPRNQVRPPPFLSGNDPRGTASELGSGRGQLGQLSGRAQAEWGKLTNDEVTEIEGDRKRLEGKIQELYGKTRDGAGDAVDAWLSRL
jgi:uncharacterized protein YjbJ (UPF0337 family)